MSHYECGYIIYFTIILIKEQEESSAGASLPSADEVCRYDPLQLQDLFIHQGKVPRDAAKALARQGLNGNVFKILEEEDFKRMSDDMKELNTLAIVLIFKLKDRVFGSKAGSDGKAGDVEHGRVNKSVKSKQKAERSK